MEYNLTVHYKNDPCDERGYDDVIECDNLDAAIAYVDNLDDREYIDYYVIEGADNPDEYFNYSETDEWREFNL